MIPSTVHVSPDVDDDVIVRLLQQGYRVVIAPAGEEAGGGVDYCTCWDIGRSCNCYCGYEARRRPAA